MDDYVVIKLAKQHVRRSAVQGVRTLNKKGILNMKNNKYYDMNYSNIYYITYFLLSTDVPKILLYT